MFRDGALYRLPIEPTCVVAHDGGLQICNPACTPVLFYANVQSTCMLRPTAPLVCMAAAVSLTQRK